MSESEYGISIYHDVMIYNRPLFFSGSEYAIVPDLLRESIFCQILIEIHGEGRNSEGNPWRRPARDVVELVRTFAKYEYYLFSYEINGFHLSLCEFSFIHKSCMQTYGVSIILGKIF